MGNVCSNPIPIPSDAIFSRCLDCFTRKAAYVSELKDNVNALETELPKLIAAREDVMRRVVLAEQQQMQQLSLVQVWLSRVHDEETAVGELLRDGTQEIEKLCLGGYCSKNCRSSYKLGKKVAKKLQTLATLQSEGAFEVVAERVPEAAVDKRPTESAVVGLQRTFDKVWTCLVEESAGIIGLYGKGGVGKTTLLTQINNKFPDRPNGFDVVIWVVVSKDLQLQRIQETIGKNLGLLSESLKNSSVEENASTIFKILSKKKFVLLLDDIWKRVDLAKVGIPHPSPAAGSKIAFTTRFFDVCGLMEAEKKFKVECLAEDEAWNLFQKKVGEDTLNSHPDIRRLAKIVAKECGGLPLALITIGRAMSSKKITIEWSYAIHVLKTSPFKFSGMEEEVCYLLKFSYDSLSGDRIRLCLLYCSLFSEDYRILKRNLIDCWIGEGFLDEDDVINQQNQGYSIICDLVRASLLEAEEDNGEDYVKMHDVIRDMALWIACETDKEKEHFLVHAGAGLTEAPKIEKWEGVRRMSLMQNRIEPLSEVPPCTNLLTLFLNHNELKMITNDFFKFMSFFVVLDLSKNFELDELPSGISKLVSLHHLNLSYTSIRKLPMEVKNLINLKYLSLENTYKLCEILCQLISTLSKLQILRLYNFGSYDLPEVEGDNVLAGGGELLVDELLGLKHLNVLDITLRSHRAVEGFLSSVKLHSCIQSLYLSHFEDSPKSFNVICLEDLNHLHKLYIGNFRTVEELKTEHVGKVQKTREPFRFHSLDTVIINQCSKLRDLTWLVFVPNLKMLDVAFCLVMGEILSVERMGEVSERLAILNPFQRLQYLRLQFLKNLKSIYLKALPFPHLKEILVLRCRELKKLPLDSNSAKERKIVIKGEKEWWKELQWEDEATQNAFLPCFESTS